ncbi:MAG TPA: hypothetical protein VHM16_01210, partial [Rubrobacteraceae bacterium]|nr:hypothetical protein [Rubrobacteraceae bacterium]
MRLAAIRLDGREAAAVVTPAGAVPVERIGFPEYGVLSLLEGGRFYELLERYEESDGFASGGDAAAPLERVQYAPLYRRPRKIWGIG